MSPDDYLVPKEAAKCLRVSAASLDRAVKRGELRCIRIGRLRRFKRGWLDELEARSRREPGTPAQD